MNWIHWFKRYETETQAVFIVNQLVEYYLEDNYEIVEYSIFKTKKGEFRIKYIVEAYSPLKTKEL